MNYQSLYDTTLEYLARDDVGTGLFNTWLRFVESDLNSGLVTSGEYSEFLANYDDGVILPDDFKQGVITLANGVNYQYVTPEVFQDKKDTNGFFTIKNNKLVISGVVSGEVKIEYNKKITPLTAETPENEVSKNYPALYLSGVLKQAGLWAKDNVTTQYHDANFTDALNKANQTEVNKSVSGSQLSTMADIVYIGGM